MINMTSEQLDRLLTPVDVIRDPLHGDVRLTSLERFIIERPEFQRLGNINQLALTYLAYPGATHNRFIHSIGTLHVCSKMIETCNKNARMYRNLAGPNDPVPVEIPGYCQLLARLCALCHDMAHVPFGHTLEKEGSVFQADEWQDKWRFNKIFGKESDFYPRVVGFLHDRYGIAISSARRLLDGVGNVLRAKKQQVETLPFPFVHDLVGNTICADLIDYIQRDMYFCGLTESFGKRFLEYLAVLPTKLIEARNHEEQNRYAINFRESRSDGDNYLDGPSVDEILESAASGVRYRLVLLQYRYNEKHLAVEKHDVIAEGIDLVRKRLAVAEKLYYHRTKVVGSSMLITAAHDVGLNAELIWEKSDAQVIEYLEASELTTKRASKLATKLRTRRLYKPLFRASFHEKDESAASKALWDEAEGAYARFSRPESRAVLIEKVEQIIANERFGGNLEEAKGSVTISCPNRKMSLKAFDMLVLRGPSERVMRLQESIHRPTRKEIESIIETHENLWRLEVFVDPDLVEISEVDPFAQKLAAALQSEFGIANEAPLFRNVSPQTIDTLLDEGKVCSVISRLGIAVNNLTVGDYKMLASTAHDDPQRFPEYAKRLLTRKGYVISRSNKPRDNKTTRRRRRV
jgi:HD superfamily phosphohydrolase